MKSGTPPPYISRIAGGRIVLAGDCARLPSSLGLQRHGWNAWCLEFDDQGPALENVQLAQQLDALARAGIAFLDDPRQGWSPADVARELQGRGRLASGVQVIAWSGPGQWRIETNEPA